MTPNEKLELKLAYEAACTNYLAAFMEQYDLSCDPEPWVANEVGTVALIGDHYYNMEEIRLCVDEEIPYEELMEWVDYNQDAIYLNLGIINLRSWHMGYRGTPKETCDKIKALRNELDEMIDRENKKGGF